MAVSLSLTAAGIILLYLLDVQPSHSGETLNAVVFGDIIASLGYDDASSHAMLVVVLAFEGALLFVAANTGFSAGRPCSPTWRWIAGCRTSSAHCPRASHAQRRAADGAAGSRCSSGPKATSRCWSCSTP